MEFNWSFDQPSMPTKSWENQNDASDTVLLWQVHHYKVNSSFTALQGSPFCWLIIMQGYKLYGFWYMRVGNVNSVGFLEIHNGGRIWTNNYRNQESFVVNVSLVFGNALTNIKKSSKTLNPKWGEGK